MSRKRLKPKLNEDKVFKRPFYGSRSLTSRTAGSRKNTHICPDYTCKYTSRNWVVDWKDFKKPNQVNSVSSTCCPHHRLPLINMGHASHVPKAGTKERKELIESLQKKAS